MLWVLFFVEMWERFSYYGKYIYPPNREYIQQFTPPRRFKWISYIIYQVYSCATSKQIAPQPRQFSSSANTIEPSKWDIYCIYGVFSWYIQQYTPSTSAFFRPRPAASDEKLPRFRGYIVAYTPRKHRIYITYIPLRWCISWNFRA